MTTVTAKHLSMLRKGMSLTQVASAEAVEFDTLRRAAARQQIKVMPDYAVTIRNRVQTMDAADAVNFLLDCLEKAADFMIEPGGHPVDDMCPALTPSQRRIMIALWNADGGILTRNQMLSAMAFGRPGDEPAIKIVDVQVCKIRKVWPESAGIIETVWGVGLRLTRPGRTGQETPRS